MLEQAGVRDGSTVKCIVDVRHARFQKLMKERERIIKGFEQVRQTQDFVEK